MDVEMATIKEKEEVTADDELGEVLDSMLRVLRGLRQFRVSKRMLNFWGWAALGILGCSRCSIYPRLLWLSWLF